MTEETSSSSASPMRRAWSHGAVFAPMFRGYRLALCFAFGWLILAAPSQSTSLHSDGATHQLIANDAVTGIGNNQEPRPDKYDERCYDAKSRDNADLCAQWRAAIGAEKAADRAWWSNLIGFFGAVLSFVSIVLVVIALRQTREANQLTKAEMEASRFDAAKLAKETSSALAQATRSAQASISAAETAQQALGTDRAWVCAAGIEYGLGHDMIVEGGDFAKEAVLLFPHWRNFGGTPAMNVSAYADHMIIGFGEEIPIFQRAEQVDGAMVVAPSESIGIGSIGLNDRKTKLFRERKICVVVYGHVRYRDIFNPDIVRVTESCMVVTHLGGKKKINNEMVDALSIEPKGPQNSAA